MRHTNIFLVLKVLKFISETNLLTIFIIFWYVFESYYYLRDCFSVWYVCNTSKRSHIDFCGCTNCESIDLPMTKGEVQNDDEWQMWFLKRRWKNLYQINVEIKYTLFKYIIRSFSKHKIYKLWTFFGSVFPGHVMNLRIYLVNPCILSIYEKERIIERYVNLQNLRSAYLRIQVFYSC